MSLPRNFRERRRSLDNGKVSKRGNRLVKEGNRLVKEGDRLVKGMAVELFPKQFDILPIDKIKTTTRLACITDSPEVRMAIEYIEETYFKDAMDLYSKSRNKHLKS